MTASTDEVREAFSGAYRSITGRPAPYLAGNQLLSSLDLDSLDKLELVEILGEKLGKPVSDEELASFSTIENILDFFTS